ncbi:MAG: AraC family transcriptional regulator [Clostridia bacterium]|nr:AraC family transcriptional regulator [Clostridia bacterium]
MTISQIAELTGAMVKTTSVDLNREIDCGYSCDLLSWVMAHGARNMAWVTVQTHMNVIAVATLMDMSAVIAPEGINFPDDVIAKADEEGIALLQSSRTAYELCGLMFKAGIPAK